MSKLYSLLAISLLALFTLPSIAQTQDSCRADFERVLTPNTVVLNAGFHALPWATNDKRPEQICWNFGDNHDTCIKYDPSLSNNYFVAHTYQHTGSYNVCVRIQYQGGCVSEKCKLIQIGIPDSCTADFETAAVNSSVLGRSFAAIPWHNQNKKPAYICWNFGDHHDTCIQYATTFTGHYTVSHNYATAGQYEVCVRIVYEGGCESKKCKVIIVGNPPPDSCHADFERIPVASTNDPLLAHFRALPFNKKPSKICWTFGDGRDTCISYAENYTGEYTVGHHYYHSGNFEVCVIITYYGGCEARNCKVITISPVNTDSCHVRLYEIISSVTSLSRVFYVVSTTTNRPARICWTFGDGTDTCVTIEPNATEIPRTIKHTYPAPGVYHACVKVLFSNGCTATDCVEVVIRSLTDLCGGYYTDSLVDSRTYAFKGFSIHKPDDNVISFRWNFGDGSSGTGERVSHTYREPGTYRVCLVINTEKGCETKICNDVKVIGTNQSRLQLTPNPALNVLHVLYVSSHSETVKIRIVNASGVVVKEFSRTTILGLNAWEFDVSGLLPGVYTFVLQSPNQFATGVFSKQ